MLALMAFERRIIFIFQWKLGQEASVFEVSQDVPPKFCQLFLKATVTDIFNYLKPYSNSTMLDFFLEGGGYGPLEIFYSYGDVTICGKVLQILTNTPHSLQFSSGVFLVWQTYCHTGHPFIIGILTLTLTFVVECLAAVEMSLPVLTI